MNDTASTGFGEHGKNGVAPVLLVALALLVLLPALSLRIPVLRGDALYEVIPRLMAVARNVQNGALPLWDPHTFAGAKPFYADDAALLFYPVMLPFYWLADTTDPAQSLEMLVLIPYAIHVLWACAGAYLFARLVLRLGPAAAVVMGLLWGLSPDMTENIEHVPDAFLFSYVPWAMLAAARFMATRRLRWWILGTLCLVVIGCTGGKQHVIRIYFAVALTVSLLWILDIRRPTTRHACQRRGDFPDTDAGRNGPNGAACVSKPVAARRRPRVDLSPLFAPLLRSLLPAALMFVFALGMAAFAWAGTLEAVSWMKGYVPMTHEIASGLDRCSSMHPLYLVTVFVPDFYGVLDSRHAWGAGYAGGVQTSSVFTGGLFTVAAALAALAHWIPRRPRDEEERRLRNWTWIAALTFVLFLLAVLGRYTPVFRWLCAVLPWFFRFPHAVYYRFACCWSLAILAGIGLHGILNSPRFRGAASRRALAALCIGLATAGIAAALLAYTTIQRDPGVAAGMRGYEMLTAFGEWGWFLRGPLLYAAVASAALLVTLLGLRPRTRNRLLVLGVLAETCGLAILLVYVSLSGDLNRQPGDFRLTTRHRRHRLLSDYAGHRLAVHTQDIASQTGTRWTSLYGDIDNQAWAVQGRALLGFSGKPLLPRFQDTLSDFTGGIVFSPIVREVPLGFFRNMNVGVIADCLLARPLPLPIASRAGAHPVYTVTDVLPSAYLQDRVVAASPAKQKQHLLDSDLRQAVYVDRGLLQEDPRVAAATSAREPRGFTALQQQGQRDVVDRSLPNRARIDVDIEAPAMLVLTQCWHPGWKARVNGQPAPVRRVNYIQQGIWLERGWHSIELRFFPASLKYGIVVSAAAWLVFLGVVIAGRQLGKKEEVISDR